MLVSCILKLGVRKTYFLAGCQVSKIEFSKLNHVVKQALFARALDSEDENSRSEAEAVRKAP